MSNVTIRYVMTLLALLASAVVLGQSAQSGVPENPELANARALLQAGREQMIRDDLQLSEAESAAFWPVYYEYRDEKRIVQDQQADMIAVFLETYRGGGINDAYAEQLLEEHFAVEGGILEVQMKYVPNFREVLSALKVARFYQLENKMDAEIEAQLALVIPLVE